MAIQFLNDRWFRTDNGPKIFQNVPQASQWFKLLIVSAQPPLIPGFEQAGFVAKVIFDFWHIFTPTNTTTTVAVRFHLTGPGGTVAVDLPLPIGVACGVAAVWDGIARRQTVYVNGVPRQFGTIAGNTTNNSSYLQFGISVPNTHVVFQLDDHNIWNNYVLTPADISALLTGTDPTTIGTSATWRGRWPLAGTTGVAPAIGDAGLKNAFGGGGSLASGGDGSDCITAGGAGSAVYAPSLVWAPSVTPHMYVCGNGKNIAGTFTSNVTGSRVVPSQLLAMPRLILNSVDRGPLVIPWGGHSTGVHECELFSTPGTPPLVIGPNDVAELTAPPAWLNTPAGSVAALSGPIDNRSGGSSVQVETLTKTLRMGLNHASPGGLEYYPFRNAKFMVGFAGQFGKLSPGNGYQIVNQPCEAGRMYLVWDATVPLTPAQFTSSSGAPSLVTVTHNPEFDVSPSDGVGHVRGYDIAYVPNSAFETTVGGSLVVLNYSDPNGASHYDNLWIYLPGETTLVDGVPVFDRSDPFALSNIYLDRVTQNLGSMRAVDITPNGSACLTFPNPELLIPRTAERFWGYAPLGLGNVGFTTIGPVDVTQTPWFYSAQFRQPANQFTATLTDTISTAPAVGTHETWHFSDGATAPLMACLEAKVDDEEIRFISGSGTDWVVYRGSNGTTPATHAPGTVTVYGRQPITRVVHPDGTAPFTAPAFIQCAAPHGMTTAHGYYPAGTFPMTMIDGATGATFSEPNLGLSRCYVTGPTSFVSIWSGWYVTRPAGAKPSRTYTLDASHFMQRLYFPGVPLDVYCEWVGKFPYANLHYNVPMDTCDDLAYTMAWTARDHFPAGRKIYVEYANEPWNTAPPFASNLYCTDMAPLAMPSALNTYGLAYYAYRAARVHQIFREVFSAVGRGGEIVGGLNCQMNSGSTQITPHLNLGLAVGQPFDAIMGAPYYSMGSGGNGIPATVAAFDQYDDDQAAEQLLHDITFDTTGIVAWMKNMNAAITAYNTAHGKTCILMGYEGGIEYAAPTGAANHNTRSTDLQYNPNFYDVEQGWFKILQDNGFDHLHIYALGIGWPASWGVYHLRTQKHSRGDGANGAADNRAYCFNPANPNHRTTSYLQHDVHNDSVRGQAYIDWVNAVGDVLSGVAGVHLQGDTVAVVGQVDMLAQGLADLILQDDMTGATGRALRTTRPAPFNATGVR